MIPDSLALLLLAIGGLLLVILIVGLVLSIIIFNNKSKTAEVFSWLCSGLWFIFYLYIITRSDLFGDWDNAFQYLIIPVFVTFFLLLQYRSITATGRNLDILFIAKTVCLIGAVGDATSSFSSFLYRMIDVQNSMLAFAVSIPTILILWGVLTFSALQSLRKTQPVLKGKSIFLSAIIFTASVYFLNFIVSEGMLVLRFLRTESVLTQFYSSQRLMMLLAYFVLGSTLPALIAALVYQKEAQVPSKEIQEKI